MTEQSKSTCDILSTILDDAEEYIASLSPDELLVLSDEIYGNEVDGDDDEPLPSAEIIPFLQGREPLRRAAEALRQPDEVESNSVDGAGPSERATAYRKAALAARRISGLLVSRAALYLIVATGAGFSSGLWFAVHDLRQVSSTDAPNVSTAQLWATPYLADKDNHSRDLFDPLRGFRLAQFDLAPKPGAPLRFEGVYVSYPYQGGVVGVTGSLLSDKINADSPCQPVFPTMAAVNLTQNCPKSSYPGLNSAWSYGAGSPAPPNADTAPPTISYRLRFLQ